MDIDKIRIERSASMKRLLCAGIIFIMMLTSATNALRAYENDRPEETALLFLKLVHFNMSVFQGNQWRITEKNSVKTIEPTDRDSAERDVVYTIDKKNWYLSAETRDALGDLTEAAMYFKKDKTPVIAVGSTWSDGYKDFGSWIKFYDFNCGPKPDSGSCTFKDVTSDIFPSLTSALFISDSPAAKKLIRELSTEFPITDAIKVMYKIPRIGTAIIATPAVSYLALGGHETCQKHVKTLSKFKSVRIKWNKQKGKFEIGEKEPGIITLYEN